MRALVLPAVLFLLSALAGCEMLGIETPARQSAAREAEARAIGGACRHAGRAIEDCYALNTRAGKAAVFAGWREMNDYMRENGIQEVSPQLPSPATARPTKSAADDEDEEEGEDEAAPAGARRPGAAAGRMR